MKTIHIEVPEWVIAAAKVKAIIDDTSSYRETIQKDLVKMYEPYHGTLKVEKNDSKQRTL
jgi:hypothetical protein